MSIAKIIRHRHKFHHYINDDLKDVSEDVQFKIVFSDPNEMRKFEAFIENLGGKYNYNKEISKQEGDFPNDIKEKLGENICWCDVMSYYLLHVANYYFKEHISPYKGEIYVKKEPLHPFYKTI